MYLEHIAESIALVEQYVTTRDGTLDPSAFHDDQRTQDAVLRRMETLADATSQLSDGLKARHPEIPWREITAFRNVLAHGYTGVRLDRVWHAIVDDLPPLRAIVERELAE